MSTTRPSLEGLPENWCTLEVPEGTKRADIFEDDKRHRIFNTIENNQIVTPLKEGVFVLKCEKSDGQIEERRFKVDKEGVISTPELSKIDYLFFTQMMEKSFMTARLDRLEKLLKEKV